MDKFIHNFNLQNLTLKEVVDLNHHIIIIKEI